MIFNAGGGMGAAGSGEASACIAMGAVANGQINGTSKTLCNISGKGQAHYMPDIEHNGSSERLTIVITVDGISHSALCSAWAAYSAQIIFNFAKSFKITMSQTSNYATYTGGLFYQLFE